MSETTLTTETRAALDEHVAGRLRLAVLAVLRANRPSVPTDVDTVARAALSELRRVREHYPDEMRDAVSAYVRDQVDGVRLDAARVLVLRELEWRSRLGELDPRMAPVAAAALEGLRAVDRAAGVPPGVGRT